ncbi:MAG: hypothetical protein ACFFCW_37240 [Candidatus Hodarchaeota archaeon]
MRLLILSEAITRIIQGADRPPYSPPKNVYLEVADPNTIHHFSHSLFDFDVSVVHIHPPRFNSIGYYHNIPKITQDAHIALSQGRTIICLPASMNFRPVLSERRGEKGEGVYEWLKDFEVSLQNNEGTDIKPSDAGRAYVITEYLKSVSRYYQIAITDVSSERRLAVVDDTEIAVGLEQFVGKGTLVMLPPPLLHEEHYHLSMSRLVDVAQRYYERAQRTVSVGDTPEWLIDYLVPEDRALGEKIEQLTAKKSEYDRLCYVLYGTGEDLENSVALLLEQFGLEVELQPPVANIDLKARHDDLDIGFAIEVTGTKGIIQKDSSKVVQAWEYIND